MKNSLSQVLNDTAQRHGDRPAVLSAGDMVTYGALLQQVNRLGGTLRRLGLDGARVGILLPNLPTFPLVFHGLLRAGGTAVMLNPLNSPREVREYLGDAGARTVFTLSALAGLLPAGTRALVVDDLPRRLRVADGAGKRELELEGEPAPLESLPSGGDTAAILYTAAHEGWARGAALSHANLIANLRSTIEAMRITAEDRVVAALPLIHAFGLTVTLNAPLAAGAAILPVERFNPARLLELFGEEGATVFAGVPAMYLGLLAAVQRRGEPEHSLRVALAGGAPLSPDVPPLWEAAFELPLRQGYGLTEAGPVCAFNRVDLPNRRGTIGVAFPDVELSIRAEDGAPLGSEEVGELCVRGENVFHGYLGEGGRSPRDFHGEWLRTGDLASLDDDGAVRFRGVLKPMFTRNGFNIYPREIERILNDDPRVAAALVTAQPEAARENDIVVAVRPASGASLTEEDVREICRANLAAYKQPTRVDLVSALPAA